MHEYTCIKANTDTNTDRQYNNHPRPSRRCSPARGGQPRRPPLPVAPCVALLPSCLAGLCLPGYLWQRCPSVRYARRLGLRTQNFGRRGLLGGSYQGSVVSGSPVCMQPCYMLHDTISLSRSLSRSLSLARSLYIWNVNINMHYHACMHTVLRWGVRGEGRTGTRETPDSDRARTCGGGVCRCLGAGASDVAGGP